MRFFRRTVGVAALAGTLAAAGCGEKETGPGRLAGDVFIALETGEEVSVAGTRVHLLPDTATIDSALARVCAQRQRELAAGPATDSTFRRQEAERAWAARAEVLGRWSTRQAVTGEDARFAFDTVPSGTYRLWADAFVEGERWSWHHPVEVTPNDTTRVSLDNARADDDPFRCQL